MSRAGTLLHTPEHGGSLFTGLPVAEAAGLRLEPGSPTTMVDDDVWDLSGLADAPVGVSAHARSELHDDRQPEMARSPGNT